jgi:hypothetical protein
VVKNIADSVLSKRMVVFAIGVAGHLNIRDEREDIITFHRESDEPFAIRSKERGAGGVVNEDI